MKTLKNLEKTAQRKEAIAQGFYDGRFASKVVPNKKALDAKLKARRKVNIYE
jgi:hypothetical protein